MYLQWRRPGFDSWVEKISWRRKWQPIPIFLLGESPQTEEPGGLQSMGSQKVGHDWATKHTDLKYNYIERYTYGLPWWLSGKESACSAGDLGLIPGSGRSPGGGHGNPGQYSCLESPMARGACSKSHVQVYLNFQMKREELLFLSLSSPHQRWKRHNMSFSKFLGSDNTVIFSQN